MKKFSLVYSKVRDCLCLLYNKIGNWLNSSSAGLIVSVISFVSMVSMILVVLLIR